MISAIDRLRTAVMTPLRDLLAGLDSALASGPVALLWIGVGLLVGWWVYVPVHELAHAFGCLAAGGSVTRLDIDPLYGAALLREVFPFVHLGSEYAGRLSGFDPRGSDLVYLATDLAPFLLTLFPGVWWLRRSGRARRPLLFGASLPWALAPFLSLTGDAYEIGSLASVHLPPARGARELVGDDLFRQAAELDLAADPVLAWGFAVAILLGLLWAFTWYWLGGMIARFLGEPPPAEAAVAASR